MIIKGLQLLLIASIFNPLCCCLAGVSAMGATDAGQGAHACCSSAKSESPAPVDSSHSPADQQDCPHQSFKSHQQVLLKDIKAEVLVPDYTPVLVAAVHSFGLNADFASQSSTANPSPAALRSARPPGLSELYCVYRI